MKVLRITFSILLLFVLVVAFGIASLLYYIDPNKMRPVLVEEVMKKTGYQLAIYDKLSWSFYPRLGINVVRMTLTAPDKAEPFLDLHNIVVGMQLEDIFRGKKELEGDLRIANVALNGVQMQNTHVVLKWENKVLTLDPIVAYMYGGVLHGVATGRDLNTKPLWDWDLRLNHVQVSPFMHDANRGNAKINISGTGQMLFQATAKGMDRDEIINSLNGKGSVTIQDGNIDGINLNYLIQSADQLLNRLPVSPPPEDMGKTAYDRITGSFDINEGMVKTDNLYLTSPAFIAKVEGNYVILTQGMNLSLKVTPQQEPVTQWEIPILITGDLTDPYIRIDTLEVQKFLAKQQMEKVKEKVDEVKEKVKNKANELIGNLLGDDEDGKGS